MLWFDVGLKRYTTACEKKPVKQLLWFDVVLKKYASISFGYLYFHPKYQKMDSSRWRA